MEQEKWLLWIWRKTHGTCTEHSPVSKVYCKCRALQQTTCAHIYTFYCRFIQSNVKFSKSTPGCWQLNLEKSPICIKNLFFLLRAMKLLFTSPNRIVTALINAESKLEKTNQEIRNTRPQRTCWCLWRRPACINTISSPCMVICFIETFVLKLERHGLGQIKELLEWLMAHLSYIYNIIQSRSTHSHMYAHTQPSVLLRYYPLLRALSKALTPPPTRRRRDLFLLFTPASQWRPPDKGNFTLFWGYTEQILYKPLPDNSHTKAEWVMRLD